MNITGIEVESKDQGLGRYIDSDQSVQWAKSSIDICVSQGIVSGKSAKVLARKQNITRAEVAAIVRKFLQQSKLI